MCTVCSWALIYVWIDTCMYACDSDNDRLSEDATAKVTAVAKAMPMKAMPMRVYEFDCEGKCDNECECEHECDGEGGESRQR